MITSLEKEKKDRLKIFVLDSLNAAYSIMDRKFIEYSLAPFFKKLKEHNFISLIIYEKSMENSKPKLRERFLADGIISLGIQRYRGEVLRFLQLLKFSSDDHSLKRRRLVASKDGISLLGPVYR